jgi:hypothetical protein
MIEAQRSEQVERALENVTVTLAMLDAVAKREQIPNRMDIAPALERAKQRLDESYRHGDLMYVDVQDIFETASKASRHVWNPKSNDYLHRQAITCVNTIANIEAQASLNSEELESIPAQYFIKPALNQVKQIASAELNNLDMQARDARALLAGLNEAVSIEKDRSLASGSRFLNRESANGPNMSPQDKVELAARLVEEANADFGSMTSAEQEGLNGAVRELGELCEVIADGALSERTTSTPSN